ncbi:MAG: PD-(D/E)XK nuclease family protein, partial [Lachnospiraceae bacterium]|nr:PD-(D/E)XK nuclease family protein [Lachnospiraceae bacterium]
IDESEIIKADVICFDGFTGFTPVQYKLIEKILKHAKKVMITITIDKANYFKKNVKEHELFAFSRTTIDKLMKIANENNIEVAPPCIIDNNYRFINNKELGHLEENIFRYPYAKYDKEVENISITVASTIDAEAEFVVRNIKKIIREKNYRYRDFAIITGDLPVYAKEFEKIFKRENMQYFIDDKKSIMNNPMVEMTSALFEIVSTNFSYESVFRYIRSTMTNLTRDEADILDNYVVALGKKGYASYSKEWSNSYRTRSSIDIAATNEIRQKLCDELQDFYKNIKKCKTINQFSDCLVSQYENLKCREKIDAFIERFEENKELDKAKEYAKVYDSLIELIDKMKNLLGEEEVTIKEYKEILEAGIEEIKVGIIPMTIDQIVVGDIERTRLNDIKVLFFVGVDDRTIPKRKDKSGIISEIDRQFLQDMGVELAPTSIQETYKEQFYLYMAFTKPKEELYISYSNTDNDGKISNASYVIKKIMKLYDNLSVNRDEGSIVGNDMGRTYLVKQLKKKDETDITEILEEDSVKQILSWHLSDDTYKNQLDKIVSAVYYHNLDSEISKTAARALYGFNDKSVTEIEKYASCAYAHFLQYGLKLYENAEYEVKLPDIGTIFHDIVNRFSTAVNGSEYSWAELPDDLRIQFTKECVKEATSDYGNMIMHSSKRNENFIKRIEEVALRTTWALLEHVKQGNFEPYGFEVGFNSKDNYVKGIKLKNGNTVGFKGFIDRVDICNDENGFYVKIIDYKSSKKEFQPTLFLEG